MEFINKIPNFVRYIVAIPFGILCLIVGYYIGYFSQLYIASPDSLAIKIYNFLYQNGINVLVMIGGMNLILPKHRFKFTLIISVIFGFIGITGLGINIAYNNITISYIVGLILTILAFIYACYSTFNDEKENSTKNDDTVS